MRKIIIIMVATAFIVWGYLRVQYLQKETRVLRDIPAKNEVWLYSSEYTGNFYSTRVKHYKIIESSRWVPAGDNIDVWISVKCSCDNYLKMENPGSIARLPFKYTCAKCEKVYTFVLDDGLLVLEEDTVLDDEEVFIRSHYVRYFYPAESN